MEKNLLTLVNITRKTSGGVIDRKCEHGMAIGYGEVRNILTYTLVGEPTDINGCVLEMMIMAAQDVLDLSCPLFGGDFTAKELAGRLSGCVDMVVLFTNPQYVSYQRICIECGTFKCHYNAKEVFLMVAEWEGMMSIPQNKAHRFPCEAEKEMEKDFIIKPYKCNRVFKPERIIINDPDQERIARKYAVLGPLSKSLTAEGMRKAFSVAAVIEEFREQRDLYDIVKTLLCNKLHDDYGATVKALDKNGKEHEEKTQTVEFSAKDFNHAPDCWMTGDRAYMQELRDYFNAITAEYPAPDWMKVGDFVQFKNQKNTMKKWQGKLEVFAVGPRCTGTRIVWYVEVGTTKGRYDSICHTADHFEAWVEPKNVAKAKPSPTKKAKSESDGTVKLKGSEYTVKDGSGKDVMFASYVPKAVTEKPSFAEQLRRILLAA